MTMLDKMRRHKSWLKWSLILVCLAFVVFYIGFPLRGLRWAMLLRGTGLKIGVGWPYAPGAQISFLYPFQS